MKEKITERFDELIEQGRELSSKIGTDSRGRPKYWVDEAQISLYQEWLSSVSNLLRVVTQRDSHYFKEVDRLMKQPERSGGIPTSVVMKMSGLLTSAKTEWSKGMLREVEYIIAAETFDDFLDHAAHYHKANKKIESSVLASAVLEDTIKKIAIKNSMEAKRKNLDPLINELVKHGVFTPVKAKRIKSYTGIRNKALHAEWDEFDIKDVGGMVEGIRELIEKYL